MLNNKPSSGFQNVLGFNFAVITLALLMTITAFGAVNSRLGFLESFTQLLRPQNFTNSISGTVFYVNAASPPVGLRNLNVCISGGACDETDNNGGYTIPGLGAGTYTVCVSETPSPNSITSYDASLVAAHVAGTPLISETPRRMAADATQNGTISSTDASYISNYATGGSPTGSVGSWWFYPTNIGAPWPPLEYNPCRTVEIVSQDDNGANFNGVLIGEVSGNYNPALRPAPDNDIAIELSHLTASAGKEVIVPVNVQGNANKDIVAYDLDLRYDSSVLAPHANLVNLARTVSLGYNYSVNVQEPGRIRLAVYGLRPLEIDGVLLNLRFTAIGAPGSVSPLTWERVIFNDSSPGTMLNGLVEVSSDSIKTTTY